jgi:hypothetical protein
MDDGVRANQLARKTPGTRRQFAAAGTLRRQAEEICSRYTGWKHAAPAACEFPHSGGAGATPSEGRRLRPKVGALTQPLDLPTRAEPRECAGNRREREVSEIVISPEPFPTRLDARADDRGNASGGPASGCVRLPGHGHMVKAWRAVAESSSFFVTKLDIDSSARGGWPDSPRIRPVPPRSAHRLRQVCAHIGQPHPEDSVDKPARRRLDRRNADHAGFAISSTRASPCPGGRRSFPDGVQGCSPALRTAGLEDRQRRSALWRLTSRRRKRPRRRQREARGTA